MATATQKPEMAQISEFYAAKSALIHVKAIAPSRTNPRKHFAQDGLAELAASIKTQGVMSPLLVRKMPVPAPVHELMDELLRQPEKSAARYEIVTGERRWRAAQLAGLERVPCIVREMDDVAALDAQIAENLQRSDITPLEEAHAYRARLKAAGEAGQKMTVDQLAARIGKSRRYVYDKLQLLDLGELATRALERGTISAAYASELLRLKPELQDEAVKALADDEISSVKELREWIAAKREGEQDPFRGTKASSSAKAPKSAGPSTKPAVPTLAAIERAISGSLPGLRVARLTHTRKRNEWLVVVRMREVQTSAHAKREVT